MQSLNARNDVTCAASLTNVIICKEVILDVRREEHEEVSRSLYDQMIVHAEEEILWRCFECMFDETRLLHLRTSNRKDEIVLVHFLML